MGLCECGCGQQTTIATSDDRRFGARKGEPRRFIQGHAQVGARHWYWKGGRSPDGNGYIRIRMAEHPRLQRGGYVLEHVLVAERALGRYLPRKHPVHHVDENKANNAPTNLVICESEAYHRLLHARMRALAACGDPNAIVCRICGSYDRQDDLTMIRTLNRVGYHRTCARILVAARKARRCA